ncbi:MAG: acyl--CoA ligase [Oscillospiraceae bacterium]|nr:acyl--CoA ligase [Oscillospiraceae bacterium]
MEAKLTGYPHIDMPWLKYYGKEITVEYPTGNITDYVYGKSIGHEDMIDDTYYTRDYTYAESIERINDASRALQGLGIHKNDKILCMVPNMPSINQLFFGAAQMGAHLDFIDPRPDSMDMKASARKQLEIFKRERPKSILALDRVYIATLCYIENELKDLGIEEIVVLSAMDDMTLRGKLDYINDLVNYNRIKNHRSKGESINRLSAVDIVLRMVKESKSVGEALKKTIAASPLRIVNYLDLLRDSKGMSFTKDSDSDQIVYTGHTSGTSGSLPKPIELSNANLIAAMQHLFYGKVLFKPGERVVQELPYFAPFGLCDNMLLNKVSLAHSFVVPEFQIGEFGYLVKKYKPNILMTAPAWAGGLPDCYYLKKADIYGIRKVMFGGDTMNRATEVRLKQYLIENGSKAIIEKGHGMSETAGCMCFATGEYGEPETIGIPLPGVVYGIVDPDITDRLVPLKFEEGEEYLTGENVVSSPAITHGKMNGETIVEHFTMDGKDYIRTKDIVTMNRSGIFRFDERRDRTFARFDGFKYKPREVERVFESISYIQNCVITGYFDAIKNGIMPIAHIQLNTDLIEDRDEVRIVEDIIHRLSENETSVSRQMPSKFKFYKELPQTKNNKVDFKLLSQIELDGNEINVDIDETNLSLGGISIYRNSKTKK